MKRRTPVPAANGFVNNRVFNSLLQNAILERKMWLSRLLDPRRDIEAECGHPLVLEVKDFKNAYLRDDIASRVVSIWPEESWSDQPEVFETEGENETAFEKEWLSLERKFQLYPLLQRADTLSGIGRYGIILLGVDDGLQLEQPIANLNEKGIRVGTAKRQLLYLRAFDESLVQIKDLEGDVTNPRYGQPKNYTITFDDTALSSGVRSSTTTSAQSMLVHWTRVVHLTDNRTSSDVYGMPRMEKVFNRLLDIKKIAGGSGEMFWKGGFPGVSLETHPDIEENATLDIEATREQLENYMNGLQRYLATVGMQAKSLSVQVADPGPHLECQLRLIAAALGVPWRVFIGSEASQLASEQDSRRWNKRVAARREQYLSPFVLIPFLQRLTDIGVLSEPKEVIVKWPDINTVSETDKATIAEKHTNAIAKYVTAGADALMPPFHYFTMILGMGDDEARALADEAEARLEEMDAKEDAAAQAAAKAAAAGAKVKPKVTPKK